MPQYITHASFDPGLKAPPGFKLRLLKMITVAFNLKSALFVLSLIWRLYTKAALLVYKMLRLKDPAR